MIKFEFYPPNVCIVTVNSKKSCIVRPENTFPIFVYIFGFVLVVPNLFMPPNTSGQAEIEVIGEVEPVYKGFVTVQPSLSVSIAAVKSESIKVFIIGLMLSI